MDRNQIRKDILNLVDSSPCNDVDLKEIIEKHVSGLDIEGEREVRCCIENVVTELTKSEDVISVSSHHITTRLAGKFPDSSWVIRSTHKRDEKLEAKKQSEKPHIHIEGDAIGSMLGNQSFDKALISPATQIHNNINDNNPKKRSVWEVAAWVASIAAAIIAVWEFLIKRFI